MDQKHDSHGENQSHPSLLSDIRLIFATILTDPGSSLAYGADALIAVTIVLIQINYAMGMTATIIGGSIVMLVYLLAIFVYNGMTTHHVHRELGGGAFVSALITSQKIRRHPGFKRFIHFLGKSGTASLLADFPATQAISIIAGVEALYFIPMEERMKWALGFIVGLSFVQRYGLGNLAKFMIWPVIAFYASNMAINAYGIYTIFQNGWTPPTLITEVHSFADVRFWPIIFLAVANGATLITGVEVGYSSVNIPHHRGKAIRLSMWVLYAVVLVTYSMQIVNFLGLGITYDPHVPIPLVIARHLGGDMLATPFGVVTAIMLLLAAQTAKSDFPLEILRASRSNFFPRGIGDMAWKKIKPVPAIGGHDGVYNPQATILLGLLSVLILTFFPSSHHIESMYGLAVVMAMNIDIASYQVRLVRAKKFSFVTSLGMLVMMFMLGNILYNKFFEGAWFIVVLMVIYLSIFLISEAIYDIWLERLNMVPLELGLWFPAFQGLEVDSHNFLLVSKFHPGVIHFLKKYIKEGRIPKVLHFQSDPSEKIPEELPPWFVNIKVPSNQDTISAISGYIKRHKPDRVHLIPLMVRGWDPVLKYYFGNSIERLKYAISQHADLQVEYNRERVIIQWKDILYRILPALKQYNEDTSDRTGPGR